MGVAIADENKTPSQQILRRLDADQPHIRRNCRANIWDLFQVSDVSSADCFHSLPNGIPAMTRVHSSTSSSPVSHSLLLNPESSLFSVIYPLGVVSFSGTPPSQRCHDLQDAGKRKRYD
jgi:hypothetical protein